jgi:sugar O-acyltransferase (sialic acid O-acetyltransferase NeuD family)
MLKPLIIIGAGENGEVVHASLAPCYEISGFLDDDAGKHVLGPVSDFKHFLKSHSFFISIADNAVRERVYGMLQKAGASFGNAVHPLSHIEQSARLGKNVFVGAMSYVNVHASLGNGVFINNACIVEHDNTIESFSHLAPGVITGGGVKIGERCFLGLGSRVNDHLTIGHNVTVGSGAVVTKSLPDDCTAVGIPARIISTK